MSAAIEFEGVGKQYNLGIVGTGTLSHDLNRWWQTTILRREDPYLKIGEVNDRSKKGHSDFVWALKDISFKVEQGDVVGIIGRNGAGKSTLLKILSGITAPTTGRIQYHGRIASLLEVGTGFHPEMTGRENIYMNGAIMGMTKREITRKLDEIVDFAGVERYLDTPVKRYSSGMTVRLAFSVAAFLEPEILVVDEVLTVGDAEFQKKAIGKMKDVSQGGGRTVLFVSHNMSAVKMLCTRGLVLHNGLLEKRGTAEECVDYYLGNDITQDIVTHTDIQDYHRDKYPFLTYDIVFHSVDILNSAPEEIATDEDLHFKVKLSATHKAKMFQIAVFFQDSSDIRVAFYQTETLVIPEDRDTFEVEIAIKNHNLPRGRYSVRFEANLQDFSTGSQHFDFVHHVLSFSVKYIHQAQKDEYLFWQPEFGQTLHLGENQIIAHIPSK